MTKGINTNPIANVTDPKSIRASEIPRNSEAKAVGEAAGICVGDGDGCLEVEDDDDDVAVPTAEGTERGGDLRMWTIMELSS